MIIACTLTSAELRARRAATAQMAQTALRSRSAVAHGERLVFAAAAESALRELVALEARCCPFLTVDLRRTRDTLELTITGPDEASPIIAALFRVDRVYGVSVDGSSGRC